MPAARTEKNAVATRSADCVCDACGTVLSRARDLKRHMLTHLDSEKPFKCTLPLVDEQGNESPCTYASNHAANLKTHQRSRLHANERRPCGFEGCSFEATDPSSLYRHRKRIHKFVPEARVIRAPKIGDLGALNIEVEVEENLPVASGSNLPAVGRRPSSPSPSPSFTSESSAYESDSMESDELDSSSS
ncbi:hypothetical protein DFP72DRAFT_204604 [Ephemerocybe angulata]|uniref:C2H2-type domain-containing protein n=1 Tax=Ephemerocybe angulata TaxID=980116 RepID=A0A8H6IJS6_9AGAR|nr:hypothetical protein DFP72DRAFT_204604 [Tulosesus angulatus]